MDEHDDFDAPRDDLTREYGFEIIESRAEGDGLTMSGYAAVFNSKTRVDSWEGLFDEVIAPGAFKRSINARTPVLMFDHGQHPLIGSMPIGAIRKIKEDARGLYVEARMFDNWLISPLRDAISEQAVNGMSFRFSVVRDSWDRTGKVPLRTLLEVKSSELGPVVFPQYTDTNVAVRSLLSTLPDELRAEMARELGTSTPPAVNSTGEEPATQETDPPEGTRSIPESERRRRLLVLEGLK